MQRPYPLPASAHGSPAVSHHSRALLPVFLRGLRGIQGVCSWLPKAGWGTAEDCSLPELSLQHVTTQLGGFLTALHAVPWEVMQVAGLPSFTPEQMRETQRDLCAEVQSQTFPLLSAEERAWSRGLFEPYLADPTNWCFEPVLVHGDFDASNILCDPVEGNVLGIIDFEEASVGDPAWDLCVLAAEYGSGSLLDLLSAYRLPLDGRVMDRIAFHS